MANTKKLTPEERKQAKRTSRRAAKAIFSSLTPAQKKAFRRSEHRTAKAFLAELEAKAAAK